MKKIVLAIFLCVLTGLTLFGQKVDPTLDEVLNGAVHAVSSQSDGQIILGGAFSPGHIVRVNLDQSVDTEFAKDVEVGLFNRPVHSLSVLANDKVLVAGEFTNFDMSLVGHIALLNSDGSLDHDFAAKIGTGFDDIVYTVEVQKNGQLLVGGAFHSFNGEPVRHIARLNQDGTLDTKFNPKEGFDRPVRSIASQEEGRRILVGGEFSSYNGEATPFLTLIDESGQIIQ